MEPITIRDLLDATGGTLLGDFDGEEISVTSVVIDSREAEDGALFVAIPGERVDGHTYIAGALNAGAAGCLTEQDPGDYLPGKFYIKVANTPKALGDLARFYRERFRIPVIGITGSVGKTTTKDMIASVLEEKFKVLKTPGNFNNELGLPLTVLQLDSSDDMCVLEMGMNHFGEIEYLGSIARPEVAIITNIGDAHIENLGSRENILKAKCEIFLDLKPDGLVVLNGDDPLLTTLRGKLSQKTVFCGTSEDADYQAEKAAPIGEGGLRCILRTPTSVIEAKIPALGGHMVYPVAMAAAVAEHYGMTAEQIADGIRRFIPTKMRMNVIRLGDITILDDAYNANPQSMRAALEVLSEMDAPYKAAILGDMLELGNLAPMLHQEIGEFAGQTGIDCLIAIGDLAENILEADSVSRIPEHRYFSTKEEALAGLARVLKPGAAILVKASRGMHFEDIVTELRELAARNPKETP